MQALKKYDVLVVGQGLAGSLLTWSLQQQGVSTLLISDEKESASRVAAGLINPVTGQRFVLANTTPQMLKHAASFYQHIESSLHISCYHPAPMLRLFNNEKEQFNCQKRLQQAQYHDFLRPTTIPEHLQAKYSGIAQQHTAWLDTNQLLDALLQQFKRKHCYQEASFNYHGICLHEQHVTWQGIQAEKLIFCEGYRMINNPFFDWLPMQPAHGEIISCHTSAQLDPQIINQSRWLLPTAKHACKIGATYEPTLRKPTLQTTSRQSLFGFANSLFKHDMGFKIIQHQAGIRPTTNDKQPFIGFHPKHTNLAVFNGFGSRGSLLIPWYAQIFSQHLQQKQTLPAHADIHRYSTLCV